MADIVRTPEPASRPGSRELSLPRPLLVLAGAVLIVGVLYWAKAVLMPVALATLLTFLLSPVVTVLQRRGLRRSIAVVLVVVMAFCVLGGVGWVVALQVESLAEDLPLYRGNIRKKIADLRGVGQNTVLGRLHRLADDVVGEIRKREPVPGTREPAPVVVVDNGQALLRRLPVVVESLVTVGLVVALLVFMLLRQAEMRNRLIRLFGHGRLPLTTKAMDEAGDRITRYLLTQSLVNGSFGLAVGLGLSLIGVPYAVLWGFLAGVLRFVPYLGPWLAALMPLALALAVFRGWTEPLLVLALFAVLEPAIFLVLEPLLYGSRTGVSDVALLVAVGFWTWLWGPVGLILATPLTVCLVVLGKYVPEVSFLVVLMGDEPALAPHVGYYQRLLAEDEDEATDIVEEYLRTHPREALYDRLLVPALAAARRDRARGALAADDERFVLARTREIVEQLALEPPATAPEPVRGRALGCPARDEADELALAMLRQLVEEGGGEFEVAAAGMLSSEMVALARETNPPVVCVGAIAPGGLANARYLIKRLRRVLPAARILVGRWGVDAPPAEAAARLVDAGADEIATTLLEARDRLRSAAYAAAHAPVGAAERARTA